MFLFFAGTASFREVSTRIFVELPKNAEEFRILTLVGVLDTVVMLSKASNTSKLCLRRRTDFGEVRGHSELFEGVSFFD